MCLVVDFVGQFSGLSVFRTNVTCVQIGAHFWGALLVALFVAEQWHVGAFPYLFVFFSLAPTLVEVAAAVPIIRAKAMTLA